MTTQSRGRRAFSLIELVIVIVIMATISAIAIPRVIQASAGAALAAAQADFSQLNSALEAYRFDHEGYPAAEHISKALTMYSSKDGTEFGTAPSPGSDVTYGPYLVKIPPVPIGPNEGASQISTTASDLVGWIYKPTHGVIIPNLRTGGTGSVDADLEDVVLDLNIGDFGVGEDGDSGFSGGVGGVVGSD